MSASRILKLQQLADSTQFPEERKACLEKIAVLKAQIKPKPEPFSPFTGKGRATNQRQRHRFKFNAGTKEQFTTTPMTLEEMLEELLRGGTKSR